MKKKQIVFLGLYLFFSLVAVAQHKKEVGKAEFDSIYFDAAVNLAKKDYVRAMAVSDSLYQHSSASLYKLKALMLSASLYQQVGQQEESIKYAVKAEVIAFKIKDYDWQAKIAGFLSTQYRNLGLLKSGKRALTQGMQIIQKVDGEKKKIFYYGLVNQEMAYYEIDGKNYKKAKDYIEESVRNFALLEDSSHILFYKASNEELLAKCDLQLGDFDAAEKHFNAGLAYLDQSTLGESVLRGLIFCGKAKVFKHRKEFQKALDYYKQAELLAISSGFLGLKLDVYNELSIYYKEVGQLDKHEAYLEKFDKLYQSDSKQSKTTLDGIFNEIVENNQQLENRQYWYVIAVGVLLFCFLMGVVYYKLRKKKDLLRFNQIITDLKEEKEKQFLVLEPTLGTTVSENQNKEKAAISKTLETKILKNLGEFEMGTEFLDKNISASYLATKVDTNTKYLSMILKQHRNKDFNNYIGGLRIKYIVQKLVHQPEYKNYKISYLAEECGFSTHSKFTAVFKKNMGITPSVFLEKLESQNN